MQIDEISKSGRPEFDFVAFFLLYSLKLNLTKNFFKECLDSFSHCGSSTNEELAVFLNHDLSN